MTANFSFAFVDLATLLAITSWALTERNRKTTAQVIGWCVLPGLVPVIAFGGYPLTHWPTGELWYGARSFFEMTQGLLEASIYKPSVLISWISVEDGLPIAHFVSLAVCALSVGQLLTTNLDGTWAGHPRLNWLRRFTGSLLCVISGCLLLHWLALRFDGLPLPMTRTGIFFLPLVTLLVSAIASAPASSRLSRVFRRALSIALSTCACYFLLCLRTSYFKEYQYGADVKDVYATLEQLNHSHRLRKVASNGLYISALNFYRVSSKADDFPEFVYVGDDLPPDQSVYVLPGPYYEALIAKEHLSIVYRGKSTEVVVAVRPDRAE